MAIDIKEFPNKVSAGLKANKNYDRFFYRFKINNNTFRGVVDYSKKTGWNKKDRISEVTNEVHKIKKEKKESLNLDINMDSTVDDIVKLYIDSMKDGTYKNARMSYYERKVKKTLGKKKAKDILPIHIEKVIKKNIDDGDSPRTAKQALEVLSPAFNKARANRIVIHNPCIDVKMDLPSSKKIVVNATQKLTMIYQAIISLYQNDPFYRAFFLLALQGRRKGEVMNLKWEHISFDHDYYVLPTTKNGEEQKIYLPPNVKECLEDFKKNVGWVFESPVNPGHRLCDAKKQTAKLKKAIGEWFTMHYTRNVMVSAMAEQGIDAIYMSGALGHSDPNTVTKYLTMNYLKGSKMASDMMQ